VCIVAYVATLSTPESERPYGVVVAIVSTPLAMFGLARYVQVLLVDRGGADPVRTVLRDPALLITGALWAMCFIAPSLITMVVD
jgi:hypothetical protein